MEYENLLKEFQKMRNGLTWKEGQTFFELDAKQIYPSSKKNFFKALNIPISTVAFKQKLFEFYIHKHQFSFEELADVNTKKLHRAIPLIVNKSRQEVSKIVKLSKEKNQSLEDFLSVCRQS